MTFSSEIQHAIKKLNTISDTVSRIVIGKEKSTRLTLIALLAGGHVLFEDIPGVGKTLLIRAISKCLNVDFARIQFTPDLIPSDIVGFSMPNTDGDLFNFHKGPLFNHVLLADEINRTSPRTQAAMLEAMSENQVTLDGRTHALPNPFFVLATQNPIEYEGTYPLPEAQLDRFLFQLSLGYPSAEQELSMLAAPDQFLEVEKLQPILTIDELLTLKQVVTDIHIEDSLLQYIISLGNLTRKHPALRLGVSPRGNKHCLIAAKAHALIEGRDYVIPEDILSVLKPVYRHRLLFETKPTKNEIDIFIDTLAESLLVPIKRVKRK